MNHATVIATFSRRMRVRLDDGSEVDARIKGKRLRPVCGDRVQVEPIDKEDDWLITRIEDRRNELSRPNMRRKVEVLAANLDFVVVVAAAEPKADWFIVEQEKRPGNLSQLECSEISLKGLQKVLESME